MPHPSNTARLFQIILNTQQIELRTNRITYTTRGIKEDRKLGTVEMWFGGETDHRCCEGKGPLIVETGEKEWSAQGYTKRTILPQSHW